MISSLKMRNFQCHKDLVLRFNPGVNVITGSSDRGKSSVIRALLWVLTNKPTGDAYRTHGTNDTRVVVRLDGTPIIRRKSKSVNSYTMEGNTYVAFGAGNVPPSIEEFINMREENFQRQHDAPFLLSESGGEVGRHLNSLADLTIIDKVLSELQKRDRALRSDIQAHETLAEKQTELLKEFDGLEEVGLALDDIAAMNALEDEMRPVLKELSNMISDLERAKNDLKNAPKIDGMEKSLGQIKIRQDHLPSFYTNIHSLENILKDWEGLKDCANINIGEPDWGWKEDERLMFEKDASRLSELLTSIEVQEKIIRTKQVEHLGFKAHFDQEMGEICPLCETPKARQGTQ